MLLPTTRHLVFICWGKEIYWQVNMIADIKGKQQNTWVTVLARKTGERAQRSLLGSADWTMWLMHDNEDQHGLHRWRWSRINKCYLSLISTVDVVLI